MKVDNNNLIFLVLILITFMVLTLGGQIRANNVLLRNFDSRLEIIRDYNIASLTAVYRIRNLVENEFDYTHYIE